MTQQKYTKRGATLSEYGLLVGLIAILALAAISSIGENTEELFGDVATSMDGAITGTTASATLSPTASPSPAGTNIFYQCHGQPSFVVFAANVNGHTIVSENSSQPFLDLAQACRDLGFSPIGTAHSAQPEAITSITDEVDALTCHNCNWHVGNHPWTFDNEGGVQDCIAQNPEVTGSFSAGATLAGFVVTQTSGIGSYTLAATVDDFSGSDRGSNLPAQFTGSTGGFGSMASPGTDDIFYTGTPDFLLCASTSGP